MQSSLLEWFAVCIIDILKSMIFLLYCVFLCKKMVTRSDRSLSIYAMPWLRKSARPKIVQTSLMVSFMLKWHIYHVLYWQKRLPLLYMWNTATKPHFNYMRWKTKNPCRSVAGYFHDGVPSLSRLFFPRRAANVLFMDVCTQFQLRLPTMHGPQSIMLHRHLFLEWGRQHVPVVFATEHSHNLIYGCLQPIATGITQDANS